MEAVFSIDVRIGKIEYPGAFACLMIIGERNNRRFAPIIAPDAPEELATPFVNYARTRFARFVELADRIDRLAVRAAPRRDQSGCGTEAWAPDSVRASGYLISGACWGLTRATLSA